MTYMIICLIVILRITMSIVAHNEKFVDFEDLKEMLWGISDYSSDGYKIFLSDEENIKSLSINQFYSWRLFF